MLLTAENIRKNYGMKQLLDDVTLDLNAGERIGLIGGNGTGTGEQNSDNTAMSGDNSSSSGTSSSSVAP